MSSPSASSRSQFRYFLNERFPLWIPVIEHVSCQCYAVKNLPNNKSDRFVEIKIDDKTETFDSKPNQQWNDDQGQQLEFENCEIGDTLKVRIIDQDFNEKLCYTKAKKLDGIDIDRKWLPLLPSGEAMKKYKMDEIKGMKIEIGIKYEAVDSEDNTEEKEEEEKQEESKDEGLLTIKLHNPGLPILTTPTRDSDSGDSDPHTEEKQESQTAKIQNDQNGRSKSSGLPVMERATMQSVAKSEEQPLNRHDAVMSSSAQLDHLDDLPENDGNRFCCGWPNRNAYNGSSEKRQNYESYDMERKSKNGTETPINMGAEYMNNRVVVDDELEDAIDRRQKLLFPKTFLQIGLKASSGIRAGCTVGYWKGLIEFTRKQEDPISALSTRIMDETKNPLALQLRLYILRAIKLMPKDPDGTSDPYLVIKIGKQEVSTRNDYIADTLDPEFYYSVQIPVKMPGMLTSMCFA